MASIVEKERKILDIMGEIEALWRQPRMGMAPWSKPWPIVKFKRFLKPNSRPYELAHDEDANLVGMRWYGEGPFHREYKPAMNIAKKSHFVIRTDDIIYNKLFAWKGSFGIVPSELVPKQA